MADRFPLFVNPVSQKIEELISGDNLDFTGNNFVISGDSGNGKYLTSDGTSILWGTPGDVYLTQTQTLTNKTLEGCNLVGTLNTLTNIPNNSLINSQITVNGAAIALWNLPEEKRRKANDIKYMWYQDVIRRYETIEYVKEIKDNNTIEDPWKFKLFDEDCGDLEQYKPIVIPHLEGHAFYYYGMIMHQMILGDSFRKGDYRITFQGHGLKCDGKWRLFW